MNFCLICINLKKWLYTLFYDILLREIRNSNEIPKSFLYSEATIKRRNNTLPSSDGNNSRASTASTSSVSSSAYGDVAMQRLSGPEEMLQRR